uniref:CSON013168 protein n=1 Tax=Culicoides sonorensis TaxID=179676 RepID=A0A336MB77_CULSO
MDNICDDVNQILPDELLLEIFEYLKKHDRLNCKCVCQKWKSIFMESACFKSDRILSIDYCAIDIDFAPASVLQHAYGYEVLILSNIPKIDDNSEPFWEQLGKTITDLRISQNGVYHDSFSLIFDHLTSVKILYLHNIIDYLEFFEMRKERFSKFLCAIEEIHFGFNANQLKRVHKIFNLMPNLKRIYTPTFIMGNKSQDWHILIDYFLEYQEKLKWITIHSDTWTKTSSHKNALCETDDIRKILFQTINDAKLDGIDFETHNDFELLFKIMEIQPSIKSLKIKSSVLPPSSLKNITHLDLSFKEYDLINFKPLEELKNLKQLSFHFQLAGVGEEYQSLCYFNGFNHEILKLNSVQQLTINISSNLQCEECFRTILKSMPNLKSLFVTTFELEMFELEMIVTYLKRLEQLHLFGINSNEDFFLDFSFLLEKPYECLTEFVMCGLHEIARSDLNEICTAFPNLKYLTLRANNWDFDSFDEVFECLFEQLNQLKKFDPRLTRFDSFDVPTNKTIEIIGNTGKSLRVLHLPFNRVHLREKLQLFAKLPDLQVICQDQASEITKSDYLDIFVRSVTHLRDFAKQIIAKKSNEGFTFI